MREILFRGKRIDNGEWATGYYVEAKRRWHKYGIHKEWIVCSAAANGGWFALHEKHAIKSDTLGQYTGLTDKNGKKIFEGDILSITKTMDRWDKYYVPPLEYHINVIVKWDFCAWKFETLCADKRYITFPEAGCHYEYEVIGNIHDNKELLEVNND